MKRRTMKKPAAPLTCNCGGGLDVSYGLVCPVCVVRVAGSFESAYDVPTYLSDTGLIIPGKV